MSIKKIYEDEDLQLYYFTISNKTKYLEDFINVTDNEKILTYDDYIISEDGKICLFYYIPKETKNSVFIKYDLLPFNQKNFIILKKKNTKNM